MEFSELDKFYMNEAFQQAEEALLKGEVPIGCVFVDMDKVTTSEPCDAAIIARGRNMTNELYNATSHAELVALETIEKSNLSHVILYVTVEPCIMCLAALRLYQVKQVIFGCFNERFGGCGGAGIKAHLGSVFGGYDIDIRFGLFRERAILLLRRFYLRENEKAPNPKKKANRVLKTTF